MKLTCTHDLRKKLDRQDDMATIYEEAMEVSRPHSAWSPVSISWRNLLSCSGTQSVVYQRCRHWVSAYRWKHSQYVVYLHYKCSPIAVLLVRSLHSRSVAERAPQTEAYQKMRKIL